MYCNPCLSLLAGRRLETEPCPLLPGGVAQHGQPPRRRRGHLHQLQLRRGLRRPRAALQDQLQPTRPQIRGRYKINLIRSLRTNIRIQCSENALFWQCAFRLPMTGGWWIGKTIVSQKHFRPRSRIYIHKAYLNKLSASFMISLHKNECRRLTTGSFICLLPRFLGILHFPMCRV